MQLRWLVKITFFPSLHQFKKNILGDHHSSKAICRYNCNYMYQWCSRGKLCELKVWAEFFFLKGAILHTIISKPTVMGENCQNVPILAWCAGRAPHDRCATWTVLALTHLRQLRRVFGHCSQHKCSCLLVEPLCVEVRYGYPLSLKYNLVG